MFHSRKPRPVDDKVLQKLDAHLVEIIGAIHQVSNRRARMVTGIVLGKIGGAAVAGGATGLVSLLGTASTGTAIASLSGAASTTATLYWIGGLVGGGVAAGGLVVGGIGFGSAYVVGTAAKNRIYGRGRRFENLEPFEQEITRAAASLRAGIAKQRESGAPAMTDDLSQVAEIALTPLVGRIGLHLSEETRTGSFRSTLVGRQRRRLERNAEKLGKMARRFMKGRS